MPLPARNSLAVIGAGPIGLEAAAAAIDVGFDVHVFERGDVGAHAIAWGHVRMFTPWRMNIGPAAAVRLAGTDWTRPDAETCPTGRELAERYLAPLAALSELKPRVHERSRVVHVGRRGLLKADDPDSARRGEHPFRLMVRDSGGRENFVHAFAVIDASGVYGQPNWAGDGGIPARGELYLAPQMSYHVDDVLDLRRERYAGKGTIVIGAGASAATVVANLARLADEVPGTTATWVTRGPAEALYADEPNEPRAQLRELHTHARALVAGGHPAVRHVSGAVVEALQYNSATHRYTATLVIGDRPHNEESDQVVINTGFGPDHSIYRELQVHESYTTRGPMKLAVALKDSGSKGCTSTPHFGAEALVNPEPNFYVLGHKSYGRARDFLLETGYRQVADVISKLAADLGVAPAVSR